MSRARMFNDIVSDTVRPVTGTDQWVRWNADTRRLEQLGPTDMAGVWEQTVCKALKQTADDMRRARRSGYEKYARRAVKAGDLVPMTRALKMAHSLHPNPVRREDIDSNPLTLGVANGVLDFMKAERNGRREGVAEDASKRVRRAGRASDMIVENAGVAFRPGATHPLWDSYLDTFLPDLKYRGFVRKAFGYGLLGGNPARLMVFLKGPTSTGKSTIIRAVQAALGGYAATVSANALFREKQDAAPEPEMIAALPKRMVFSSEVGNNNRLHADVIKRLTGGDPIAARALYSNTVDSRVPMFTPYIATNSMPTITDGDAATWRRVLVLPFEKSVPPELEVHDRIEGDPEALEAVLAWLVEGLLDYLDIGIENRPEVVELAHTIAKAGTSDFAAWFYTDFEVTGDPEHRIPVAALWETFQRWQDENVPNREHQKRLRFVGHVKAQGVMSARKDEPRSRTSTGSRKKVDTFLGIRPRE